MMILMWFFLGVACGFALSAFLFGADRLDEA